LGTPLAQADGCGTKAIDLCFLEDFPPLIPGSSQVIENICSGEKIVDMMQMCHRFESDFVTRQLIGSSGVSGENFYDPGGIFDIYGPKLIMLNWSMYNKISTHLKFIRRYTISQATGDGTMIFARVDLTSAGYSDPDGDWNPLKWINFGQNGVQVDSTIGKGNFEIFIPYENSSPFVVSGKFYDGLKDGNQTTVAWIYQGHSSSWYYSFTLWQAWGDDSKLAWLIGSPILQFAPS